MWAPSIGMRLSTKVTESHAITVDEILDLLESEGLRAWCRRYLVASRLLQQAIGQLADPVFELFVRIGEEEEKASQCETTFNELDANFELLAQYEAQGEAVAEAWIALTQVENELEVLRERSADIQSRLRTRHRLPMGDLNSRFFTRLEQEQRDLQPKVASLEQQLAARRNKHMELVWKKEAMWRQVAETWSIAFRARMAFSEHNYRAERFRGFLETAEQQPGGRPVTCNTTPAAKRADGHRAELDALRAEAEQSFGCVLIGEFMFWPLEGDPHFGVCVPLIREHDLLNIQVEPFTPYKMCRRRGLTCLEPFSPAEAPPEQDYRLDAFFLFGRPGLQRRPKTIRAA